MVGRVGSNYSVAINFFLPTTKFSLFYYEHKLIQACIQLIHGEYSYSVVYGLVGGGLKNTKSNNISNLLFTMIYIKVKGLV